MGPAEINTFGDVVVHKLGSCDGGWRLTLLDPVDERREDVVLGVKGDPSSRGIATLTEYPGTRTAIAVVHARDAEKAQVVVDLGVGAGQALPESFGVECGDLMILTAVVAQDLASAFLVLAQVLRPSLDAERVLRLGESDIIIAVAGRVPFGIAVDDVPEPFLLLR